MSENQMKATPVVNQNPEEVDLKAEVQRLKERLRLLEEASDTNAKVFSDSLRVMDSRTMILMKLVSFLFKNISTQFLRHELATIGLFFNEDCSVDWNKCFSFFLDSLEEGDKTEETKQDFPEEAVIFGGDV